MKTRLVIISKILNDIKSAVFLAFASIFSDCKHVHVILILFAKKREEEKKYGLAVKEEGKELG